MLGGVEKLREYLRVPMSLLDIWMVGLVDPPTPVFLKVVDLVNGTPTGVPTAAQLRAREMRASILAGKPLQPGRRVSADEFLHSVFDPSQGRQMIEAAMEAALDAAGTQLGNLQLAQPDGLHIVTWRGFKEPFLRFFAVVDHRGTACGAAAQEHRQVVVPDVESDPIFAGTAAGEAVLKAGARAVQSTPLLGQSGGLLGVLSTHEEKPGVPEPRRLQKINSIAQRAAFWLDGGVVAS